MNSIKASLLTLFSCLFFALSGSAQEKFNAKVVGVVDGDTITLLTKDGRQMMVRLAGVDAPEKNQDFGQNSYQFLSGLISNQTVTVSNVEKDCLDRQIASVAFNNKDLSLLAIKSGNAWADTACSSNESLVKEESTAKEKKFGLWEKANAVRPSDFYKTEKSPQPVANNQTNNRRIFTGLGPTPPPILTASGKPSGLYVKMPLPDFIRICGEGKKSSLYTSDGYQSFDVDFPDTKENQENGCAGRFSFNRNSSEPSFRMSSASQSSPGRKAVTLE